MESMHDLEVLLETGRRFIVLETEREGCFIEGFRRIAKRSNQIYFQWTITQGLERLAPGFESQAISKRFVAALWFNSIDRAGGRLYSRRLSSLPRRPNGD